MGKRRKEMKLFGLPIYLASVKAVYPPTSCFTCNEASLEACKNKGRVQVCQTNEEVCQVEIRKRGGRVRQVDIGCKQGHACLSNMAQNFQGDWNDSQCRPGAKKLGVPFFCRQCCDGGASCGVNFALKNSSGMLQWRRRMFSFAIENEELLKMAFSRFGSKEFSDSAMQGAFSYAEANTGSNKGNKQKATFIEEYEEIPYGEMNGGKFQVSKEEENDATDRLKNTNLMAGYLNR